MRLKRFSAAAIVLAVCVGGLRVGARVLFRPTESRHQTAHPCGALVWRTATVTRKSRFDPVATVVGEESFVELEGRPIVSDVADFHCGLRASRARSLSMMAAVVRRTEGERANVSVFDASGRLERVVHFAHDVESTSWPNDPGSFVALGPHGEISVADLDAESSPLVLARDKAPIGGRVKWSSDGKTACFVTGAPPAADAGNAELSCSLVPAPPVTVARAAWTGSDTAVPWVGWDARGGKPHLCGEGLEPRDVACLAITRSLD